MPCRIVSDRFHSVNHTHCSTAYSFKHSDNPVDKINTSAAEQTHVRTKVVLPQLRFMTASHAARYLWHVTAKGNADANARLKAKTRS